MASVLASPQSDAEGLTCQEIADAAHQSVKTIREKMKRLHAAGRLSVAFVHRPALNGRMQPVPVYRLKASA